jgi:hypothetical protein
VTFAPVEEGQISMTGEFLGLRTKKRTTDGEYVIASYFLKWTFKTQTTRAQHNSE